MSSWLPLAAIAGAGTLTLLVMRVLRRKPAVAIPPLAPVAWNESWSADTARLAYEHAREADRQIHATIEVIDRKVVAVFTVASAIATFGPALGKFALWSGGWWLSIGAVSMWLLTAIQCWRAFDPRGYRLDPDPTTITAPDWLRLSPGAFYLERLKSVRDSIEVNSRTINARAAALRGALKFALIEVGFLLAALLWR